MKYIFETATPGDSDEILRLYRSAIGREGCTWSMEYPGPETLADDLKRERLFVMRSGDGEIIGAVSVDKDEAVDSLPCWNKELFPGGELARLVVREGYENRGLARELITCAMEKLAADGLKSAYFLVSKKHKRALASYEKLHFEKRGECTLFGNDWWCYQKELG